MALADYAIFHNDPALGIAFRQQIAGHLDPRLLNGCILHRYAFVHHALAQARFNGVKYYIHTAIWVITNGRLPLHEVSHICGRGNCTEASHLCDEPNDLNQTRKCCHWFLGVHPGFICPHQPPCLHRPRAPAPAAGQ
jgi:Zinc-binding loop region of homing endonuclease